MQITLIRHLPTEWNKKNILQGKKDIPLSPLSDGMKREIERNKHFLETMATPDVVLASSLRRARQTARLYGYESKVERLLDELDFGPLEGKSKSCLLQTFGKQWLESPRRLTLGEKLTDFERRIRLFIEKYHHYDHVLVFGHGSWIRGCISLLRYGTIDEMNKLSARNNELFILFPPTNFEPIKRVAAHDL